MTNIIQITLANIIHETKINLQSEAIQLDINMLIDNVLISKQRWKSKALQFYCFQHMLTYTYGRSICTNSQLVESIYVLILL